MYFLYFSGKDTKRSKKNFAVFSQKSRDLCGSNPRPLVLTRTYVGTYVGTNTVNKMREAWTRRWRSCLTYMAHIYWATKHKMNKQIV